MKVTTLLLSLGVGCGLIAARGFSLARDNALPHGGYPIASRNVVPHGCSPISPIPTRSRRREVGPAPLDTTASGDSINFNWAGVVIQDPPPNEHFVSAFAQFQVPENKVPDSAPVGKYVYSIWVGIDGADITAPGLFQGGLAFTLTKGPDGVKQDSDAWVEWIPDAATGIDGTLSNGDKEFSFKPGDWIEVHVDTDSGAQHPTTGTITITNLETNRQVTRKLHAPTPEFAVVGKNVEWIVERTMLNNNLATFPDFGEVHFDNCGAKTKGNDGSEGRFVDLHGANHVIVQDGPMLMTSVEIIDEASEFRVHYAPRPA